MMFCVFSARGRMRIIPLFRRLSPKRRRQKLMGEDIRKNEMSDLLTSTITDLLAAGLTSEELSLYSGMPPDDVEATAAGEDVASVTMAAVLRIGKISYLLEDLRKRCAKPNKIELILRAEVAEASIERFLGQPVQDHAGQNLPAD